MLETTFLGLLLLLNTRPALVVTALSALVHRYVFQPTSNYQWTAIIVILSRLLCLASWHIILYPKIFSPLRGLPTPSGGSFFMGHFPTMRKEPSGVPQLQWAKEIPNKGLIRYFSAFNEERVLITSTKGLAEVLVHKCYEFTKPAAFRTGFGRVLGIGILFAEGDEHKHQRKLLNQAFSFRQTKSLYPMFWEKARELVAVMSKKHIPRKQESNGKSPQTGIVEVGEWSSRATLDIIGVAGLGQDFNSLETPENELNQVYRAVFSPNRFSGILQMIMLVLPSWLFRSLPLKRNKMFRDSIRAIKQICYKLVSSKKERLQKTGKPDSDVLSHAIQSGGFSDEGLVNQLMTFLAAGHETTASAMTWAIYLLCQHADVQTKLRDEIRAHLPSPSSDTPVTSNQIDSMPYLNAVVNEILRVYPPVPLTFRVAAQDTTILSQHIPKGTTVILAPWVVNALPELWGPDADKFDPERWIKNPSGGVDSNYSFLTFLHGPRSCIGSNFAKAEFACLLAAWVGKFQSEMADPNFQLDIANGITARPRYGLQVKATELEGW